MQIKTTRFGDITVDESKIILFNEGLIGFIDNKKFTLLEHKPGSPFFWLQSVDSPDLAFIVIDPASFSAEYKPQFLKSDLEALGLRSDRDAQILVIVVVPEDPKKMYANLLGPLVINPVTRKGKQIILGQDKYSTCHYIIDEMMSTCGAKDASAVKKD